MHYAGLSLQMFRLCQHSAVLRSARSLSRMSVRLRVTLLNGRQISLDVDPGSSLDELTQEAQVKLGVGRSRLFRGCDSLEGSSTVEAAGLRADDDLQLVAQTVQVYSSKRSLAFVAVLGDGSVVTWGHPTHGGDSSLVQSQLQKVKQIKASEEAFAAVMEDGSVVTWGSPSSGGDSSLAQPRLKNVQQIKASDGAFAAVLGMDLLSLGATVRKAVIAAWSKRG